LLLLLHALEPPPKLLLVFHQLDAPPEELFDAPLFQELEFQELESQELKDDEDPPLPQKEPPPQLELALEPPENQSPPPQAFEAAELLLFEKKLLRNKSSARIVLWPDHVVQPDDQADEELLRPVSLAAPHQDEEDELTVHWFPQDEVLPL
jgi:hypothetical protein